MKLIAENLETKMQIIEAKSGKKNYFIEGKFMQGELVNGNGRQYPISVLEKAVKLYQPMIDSKRAIGELNHPPSPAINYDRAAILTTSLIKEGNDFIGRAKLLSTPKGELLKGLVDDGVQLAVSSRGLGSIKEIKGINIVQEDFTLSAAADVVSDPSAPDAFVQGIVEGLEWVYGDGGILVEQKVEELQKLAKQSAKKMEEQKIQAFSDFLDML